MPKTQAYNPEKARRRKRLIGAVAIALLLVFTVLAIFQVIDFIVWVILDLAVAAVANLLFRRVDKVPV